MIDIRPIQKDDIDIAKKLLPSDAAEPSWGYCYVVLDDNEIVGIMGTEVRLSGLLVQLVAEPLYMARTGSVALLAMGFLDGILRSIASVNGLGGYGFTISNTNERFQGFCERHLPVKVVQATGETKSYWRAFS